MFPLFKIHTSFFPLLLLIGTFTISEAQDKFHFVIDPGHGGKDPGTQQHGLDEKDLTLDLAKRVKKILTDRGYSSSMTRDKDIFLSLQERVAIANKVPNSIFISLHFNSSKYRSVIGIETFYWPGSVKGQKLASFIQGELNRRIVTKDRGFKPEDFGVLKTKSTAALVECGFLSNRWEAQRCQSSWFKQVLAEEIAQALIRYSEETLGVKKQKVESTSEATTSTAKKPAVKSISATPVSP